MEHKTYKIHVITLLCAALLLGGCAANKNPNITTPAGQSAATNLEIVKRIGELQNVTIQANKDKQLSDADADKVVAWTTKTNRTLGTNPPNGWQITAQSGWVAIQPILRNNQRLAPYIPIINALLTYPN